MLRGGSIGQPAWRKEDPRLVTGRGQFVGDLKLPGMLEAVILRSRHAHARLVSVDATRAAALPGAALVLTGAELDHRTTLIPMRLQPLPSLSAFLQSPLASGTVRYVGEPIAVIVATNRYLAEDAAELVQVSYEPLPAVVDARLALDVDAPVLHRHAGTNLAAEFSVVVGDVDAAIAGADLVLREHFSIQRHAAIPLETRGLVAAVDGGDGRLTVWGPTKVVHFNRSILARLLGIDEAAIRFVEMDVGGGFGARGEFYPEDFLVPYVALRLGRPVRWIEDRQEHFLSANHSREQHHEVELAVRADGTLLGLRDRLVNDMGAYVRTHGATVPTLSAAMLPGPYLVPNYRCDVRCVLTNTTPTGTYRAPGRFEAAFVRERLVDMVARQLRLDPAEVRRRNFIPSERMPYDVGADALGTRVEYDSGDFGHLFDRALDAVGYQGLRTEQAEARAAGRAVGVGLGFFVEKSGLGPWEYARAELTTAGGVAVFSGLASLGQGAETALAQIAADELSIDYDAVTVHHGDTDLVPRGGGAFASRGTVMGGSALLLAARSLKARVLEEASRQLEVSPADLELSDGRVGVRGAFERSLSLAQLAAGGSTPLAAEATFETDHMAYPYGLHVALVEVDQETGVLWLRRYLAAYDVGRAINPTLVEGQLVGGLAQGIGGTLLEELRYDEAGQLLTASFMDYLLPSASEMPAHVRVLITEDAPSPLNPLGVKGAGEGGVVGAPAAIANAVVDALGVEVRELPLTPERIRALASQASSRALR